MQSSARKKNPTKYHIYFLDGTEKEGYCQAIIPTSYYLVLRVNVDGKTIDTSYPNKTVDTFVTVVDSKLYGRFL